MWTKEVKAMQYELMNMDTVVALVEEHEEFDDHSFKIVRQLDAYLPHGFATLND